MTHRQLIDLIQLGLLTLVAIVGLILIFRRLKNVVPAARKGEVQPSVWTFLLAAVFVFALGSARPMRSFSSAWLDQVIDCGDSCTLSYFPPVAAYLLNLVWMAGALVALAAAVTAVAAAVVRYGYPGSHDTPQVDSSRMKAKAALAHDEPRS